MRWRFQLHPQSLTWNLKIMVSKFGISEIPGADFQVNHVNLQGCIHPDSSRLGVFRDPRFSLVNQKFRKRTNGDAPPPRFIVANEGIVGDFCSHHWFGSRVLKRQLSGPGLNERKKCIHLPPGKGNFQGKPQRKWKD